jgi:hypothetical protein
MHATGLIAAIMSPFQLLSNAGGLILIAIGAKSFHSLAIGARACLVLYFCVWLIMNYVWPLIVYSPFVAVAIAIVYGCVQGSTRALTGLEVAFMVLVIIGNFGLGVGRFLLRFFVQGHMYNEWIRTYTFASDDQWKKGFNVEWNERVYRIGTRLKNWLDGEKLDVRALDSD